ncbi:hypothetical protein [Spiroplasma endosymbiont of Virgichneumon dumeticola]|uniref:hypothetical protein n=1 Tax=Spiroplasma endosymbiont of Virgichneumon dumeticola TaxID=3139323 RepID=UPI0035C88769
MRKKQKVWLSIFLSSILIASGIIFVIIFKFSCTNQKISTSFNQLFGWQETNGYVSSLTTFGNDLYIWTETSNHKGKLFKFDGTTVTLVNNWQEANGWINRLYIFGNDLYIGTITLMFFN